MSSTETLESTPTTALVNDVATDAEQAPIASEDEGHDHAGHDHSAHQHSDGPALNPDCTREVTVEIPAEEVTRHFDAVTRRYRKQARIPGFRAGKVPESLIRSRFAEPIRQDVVEAMLPDSFRAAIEREGLKPVSQPQVTDIHLALGEPLKYKAIFEVVPDFSIDGYQDVRIQKPETDLTDEEFDREIAHVLESRSTMEPVLEERALADGDWAEVDFKGTDQNDSSPDEDSSQPIEGKGVMIEIGGPNTLPAFNDALRGANPGQELKFEVSYPEDFGEKRLAGKTVSYDIEVKALKKKIVPELNDDFAKEIGDYETIDEFKTKLREHASSAKRRQFEESAKDSLVQAIVDRYQFPIPETLVQQQIDARLDRGLRALANQGMSTEDMRKLDFDRLRSAQRDSALAEVKGSILLDRIGDAEQIQVPDEELDEQLQGIAIQTREPYETLRARLTEDGGLNKIREQIRREKVRTALYERL